MPSAGESKNTVASGWSPIASHGLDVTLAPGEEKKFVFVLGYVENPRAEKWEKPGIINKQRAEQLIAAFSTRRAGECSARQAARALARPALELTPSNQATRS